MLNLFNLMHNYSFFMMEPEDLIESKLCINNYTMILIKIIF
ncbi:hypothetical protein XSR1_160066 [Xenorhabdus szentirmaii DSM 16338]|uniref:Uncharacterized protein n=1 Tax=Xenorhabdus szentirmaii DSM 16338 TaxID=1427518 RepID=W1IW50_9GAMM|nr:hypothetical protein XSR1_160066 [Xenorhabdus szentirmaii DSM 16338]